MQRIIMKTTLLTLALLLVSPIIFSQKGKRFTSEAEMKAVNPDSVYIVDLSGQNLTALPVDIMKYKNLERLDIYDNQITEIPVWFFELQNIKYFNIGYQTWDGYKGNPITSIPLEITKFRKLESLDVSGCPVSELPEVLVQMEKIRAIGIAGTNINSLPSSWIKGLLKGQHPIILIDSKQKFDKETSKYIKQKQKGGGRSFSKLGKYKRINICCI